VNLESFWHSACNLLIPEAKGELVLQSAARSWNSVARRKKKRRSKP